MPIPILATKLYAPTPRPQAVLRPRLVEKLNERGGQNVTLISAPAGFGKTTLVSEWVSNLRHRHLPPVQVFTNSDLRLDPAGGNQIANRQSKIGNQQSSIENRVAWLSLDEGDNEPTRFLTYLTLALQKLAAHLGEGVLSLLQSPQPPAAETILTLLLNDLLSVPEPFLLVLDDYHAIDAKPVDQILAFLLEHLPPQMHLVIASREDPNLPLARLRAQGRLTELRAADLRFTPSEAAEFLNRVMGLNLSPEEVFALENRTEGWIAGLQLAALSMQGRADTAGFIQAFTGSHHFVLDYLIEEVLQQQSEDIQMFLLRTSILDRFCGPLCDAVLRAAAASGQETLEYLERANLFIVPLDNERQWYRYHHLFADLLQQRLQQNVALSAQVPELHVRASQWYEDNGLDLEAFQHAVAAQDIERAERLMEGRRLPLHFRGVTMTVLDWLESLPGTVLEARPLLRVRSATLALMAGQTTGVEQNLQAAEKVLQNADRTDQARDLIGQIAAARATLALTRYQWETMIAQSHRALEYLHSDDLIFRTTANWTLGVAYLFQGERRAARQALTEALSLSQASGDAFNAILTTSALGQLQEVENQLHLAAETYQHVLQLFGDHPQPNAGEVHLGLARIYYEWNDLEAAEKHGQQSLQLARQFDRLIDRFIISEVFLARLKLVRGEVDEAAAHLAEVERSARQQGFVYRLSEIAAAQVAVLLRQGNWTAAAELAQKHELPLYQARVHLARGEASAALAVLEPLRRHMETKGWADERLKVMVLQTVALHAHGQKDAALQLLGEVLALAAPEGFIRTFVDEGAPMMELLERMKDEGGKLTEYIDKLIAAFTKQENVQPSSIRLPPFVEPLSERELEILRLIAQGLSNQEIGERLFLALDTIKGHNRRIFDKLQVQRRTEAVARARELGLL